MTSTKALEFKGRMLSVSRLRVLTADLAAVEAEIQAFSRQMPPAMQGMPVVIESDHVMALPALLASVRKAGLQPLAVTDGPLAESARGLQLPVLPADGGKAASRGSRAMAESEPLPAAPPPPPAAAAAAVAARKATRIVQGPVRSGQQIYAAEGDLVVLSLVGAGAEVVADGCIHVYGAARGRVIAGAQGDIHARIFCRSFEAELVAIAGTYLVAEQMAPDLHKKPVQVWLENGQLRLERLDA